MLSIKFTPFNTTLYEFPDYLKCYTSNVIHVKHKNYISAVLGEAIVSLNEELKSEIVYRFTDSTALDYFVLCVLGPNLCQMHFTILQKHLTNLEK